jgi:hypothetical protein
MIIIKEIQVKTTIERNLNANITDEIKRKIVDELYAKLQNDMNFEMKKTRKR